MNKQWIAKYFALGLVLLFLGIAAEVSAQAAPPDLQTTFAQSPAAVFPRSPYQFVIRVKNVGGTTAQSSRLVVDLPVTNTSPQVFILGDLTGVQATQGCSVVNLKLICNFGAITKNNSKLVMFNFAFPISTKTLELKATASIVSGPGETITTNNSASFIPTFNYPVNQITSANVLISRCTGMNLTSYFECEKFPSSIATTNLTLDSGGTISGLPSIYTGLWTQNQTTAPQLFQELQWVITNSSTGSTSSFAGFATSNTCFEGLTIFSNSAYVSPYKVCIQ